MKQKKCPQCKNLISASAPTCLYCGRPNKFVTNDYVNKKWDKEYNSEKINIFKLLISSKIFVIYIIFLIVLIIVFI
tara:strand:+ start:118 stop:345 length:228 start_codon:yes stop_codon:yes gene_type:complete